MRLRSAFYSAVIALCFCGTLQAANNFPEPCDNDIYCYGPLLETIQLNHLYKDDKTFVDLALKHDPSVVHEKFAALNFTGDAHNDTATMQLLVDFVSDNFEDGTEFQEWKPADWKPDPVFLENIKDPELKVWASDLHSFWEELGRSIKEDVKLNSSKYSMHYVSHPVIVPGGRFKEFYYWDSYWIQKGLIVSEMFDTVKGMIENFFEMVDTLGFVPNGGRIYYQRTQPPLLIPMVKNYYDATKNLTFIKNNFATMAKEFQFFMQNRTVTVSKSGKNYKMARYNVDLKGPRPESYSDDYELVEPLNISQEEKEILYANLKAGAESGWDFSSRWFVPIPVEPAVGDLTLVKTRDIIPVELNSFLYWNAVILSEFCELINDTTACNTTYFDDKATEWKTAINEVLWSETEGSWFDYDFVRNELRKQFYPTNLAPLWVNAQTDASVIPKVVKYFNDTGATKYEGGIPTSLLATGQQWDFPNGWAPLNHMVVEALENSGVQAARDLAFDLAQRWTRSNHKAYYQTCGHMYEKYDVSIVGAPGGGGEYEIVIGFGWTNGVILDFLKLYGDRMTPVAGVGTFPPTCNGSSSSTTPKDNDSGSSAVEARLSLMSIFIAITFLHCKLL